MGVWLPVDSGVARGVLNGLAMRLRAATFLPLLSAFGCGPTAVPGAFDLQPVTLTPCAFTPEVPAEVKQGSTARVPLRPSRTDVALRVVGVPAGAEASVDGEDLVYRPGFESLGATAVVEVEMRCAGATTSHLLRFTVTPQVRWGTPLTWGGPAGPDAREHPALFIDPASPDMLWLYGGFGFVPRQFTITNDLWRLDLRTNVWTSVNVMDAPLVAGGRIASGLAPGEFYLVGGQTPAGGVSSDVYRFDVTQTPVRFEQLLAGGSAPTTSLGALVLDSARRRLVSFGGFDGAGASSAVHTLSLDGPSTWATSAAAGPSGRYGFFTARDGERLVVFSGGQRPVAGSPVNPAGDAWALELATLTWTKLAETTADAPGRRNGCGALDPETRRLYVWSGTPDGASAVPMLSVLDLARAEPAWSRVTTGVAPTARGSCSAVFDAPRKRVLFGFGNTAVQQFADLQVLEVGP